MAWAKHLVKKLQAGITVQFRPAGYSMRGRVSHRALCTVEPIPRPIAVDDVVLCKLNGGHNLRIVKASLGDRYLLGNNVGGTKAWMTGKHIYGKLIHVK